MIPERVFNEIIKDINLEANKYLTRRHNSLGGNDYDCGVEVGLRRAISIMKKHKILSDPGGYNLQTP